MFSFMIVQYMNVPTKTAHIQMLIFTICMPISIVTAINFVTAVRDVERNSSITCKCHNTLKAINVRCKSELPAISDLNTRNYGTVHKFNMTDYNIHESHISMKD